MAPRYKVLTQNPGKKIATVNQDLVNVNQDLVNVNQDLENLKKALDTNPTNASDVEAKGYFDLATKFDQINEDNLIREFDTNFVDKDSSSTLTLTSKTVKDNQPRTKYDYDVVAVCSVGNVYGYTASEYEGVDEDKHAVYLNKNYYSGYLPEKAGGRHIHKFMLSDDGNQHIIIDSGKGSNTSELLIFNNRQYHKIENDSKIIDASIDSNCSKVVSVYDNGDIIVSSWNANSYSDIKIVTTHNIKAVACSHNGSKFVIWTTSKVVIYSLSNGVWVAKEIDVPFTTTIDNNIYFNKNILLVLNKDTKKLHIYKVDLTNEIPSLVEVRIIDNVIKYKSHSSARSLSISNITPYLSDKSKISFYSTKDNWLTFSLNKSIDIDPKNFRNTDLSVIKDLCCDHNSRMYFLTKIKDHKSIFNYNHTVYLTTSNLLNDSHENVNEIFLLNSSGFSKMPMTTDHDYPNRYSTDIYNLHETRLYVVVNDSQDLGFTFDSSGNNEGEHILKRDPTLDYPFSLTGSLTKYTIEVNAEQDDNLTIDIKNMGEFTLKNVNVKFRLNVATYDNYSQLTDGDVFNLGGNFNGWGGLGLANLTKVGDTDIYETTIELSTYTPYQYKFILNIWADFDEIPPGSDNTLTSIGAVNRYILITDDMVEEDNTVILDIASWY